MHPSLSAQVNLQSQRLVSFDEIVPSLEEINGHGMHVEIFATVHTLRMNLASELRIVRLSRSM